MLSNTQRPVRVSRATQFIDENGVPTISSSIPLALLGLGLFAGVPLMGFELLQIFRRAATGEASEGGETWALPSDYRLMLWVTGALRTALLAWMCATAYQFFSRRSKAPRMLVFLYAASIALNMVEGVWEASFAYGDQAHAAQAIAGAVGSSIWAVIWIVYVWRSRVVKRVFVYPLREEGGVAAQVD
jgi:hypothetical protein